jgi:solute carrier family 10 (sodium/bile acid cotransporter), member 7
MTDFLKKQWFIVGMCFLILLSSLFPVWGTSLNPDKITTTSLVIALFFLSGLSLPTETMKEGMKDIRLHIFIQVFIFVISPLFFMLTAFPFSNVMDGKLIVGIYALACLPTTVSSCIVFTQLAGGNTIGTIFNASFSNLAGIFLSPLLLTLFLKGSGNPMPMEEMVRIFQSLVVKMLIPFAIGQGLHIAFKKFAVKHKKKFGVLSSIFVLIIIFFGVARSAENASLQTYWKQLIIPFIYLAVAHIVLLYLSLTGARFIGLNRENIISTMYSAPQKTLAMGIPLLSTYFANQPEMLGIAILPILFYHPWQLFIAGLLKDNKYIKKKLQ